VYVLRKKNWEDGTMIKISPFRIIIAHVRTFGDPEGNHKGSDYFWFYVLPCALGAAYAVVVRHYSIRMIPDQIWSGGLTVSAIFIPLIFTLIATLLGITREFEDGSQEKKLLRQVIDSSSYVIFMSMLLVALIFGCDWWYEENAPRQIGGAIFITIIAHIALTTLMILRRFHCLAELVISSRGSKT